MKKRKSKSKRFSKKPFVHELPPDERGLSNNKWGGHKVQRVSPGSLWNPPKKPYPVRSVSREALAEINRRRNDDDVAQPIFVGVQWADENYACDNGGCLEPSCRRCHPANLIFVDEAQGLT